MRESDLDWVLVRPPRFVKGKPRGDICVVREGEPGRLGHVIRDDLARFLVKSAVDERHVSAAAAVGS